MALRTRNERGSASVEAVIGVPAFLLLVGLLVLGGRQAIAQQAVQAAASDAARAASIARTATAARTDATTAARHSLANQDLDCATTSVTVDTAAFATEVGTPGQVRATVSCDLRLDDIGLPGVSGTKTITATMSSPLDTYRGR
ncbi:TadE/TadG family type IV pilus assembly protein [Propionicicella superfundia]|uniref:TadE/TadG family type IV pilus assembly protein n=1 Tax=Propionicicella superfundia TaxID=348582 RepID=UPI0003F5ABBD|nr:TadE/TadG family type IV pilus assembly protein [Propionicicella superfundia]